MRTTLIAIVLSCAAAGCGSEATEATQGVGNQIQLGRGAAATVQLSLLRTQISSFNGAEGRFPESLEELGRHNHFPIPTPPPGLHFEYDAATGQVRAVPDTK